MSKNPKKRFDPSSDKSPKGGEKADVYNKMNFCWRVDWIDMDGDWGFKKPDCDTIWKQIIPFLHSTETRTWSEIYGARDTSNHPMPVGNVERSARDRLLAIGRGEYETLIQLNVRGGIRLWGIRDRQIFYLLWYDPEHTVYIQKRDR